MYRGSCQDFYWKKGTYECLDVPCVNFHIKIIKIKLYLANILKSDTSSDDTKEEIYHCLDYFENSHKKYNIMPSESLNYLFREESWYITVRSPPGFINQENETRFYFNATIQLLYCNFIFIQLILNIYCYTMMIILDKKANNLSIITKIS